MHELRDDVGEPLVMGEQIVFCDLELEVEDVEVLALDAADVALAKDACAECPVDVLQCRVI